MHANSELCITLHCTLCMYKTDRGGCCCAHHMGAAAHSVWASMNPAALPHWHLPSPPITPSKPPSASQPASISAILLGLTPLHRRHHHNQIILLGHTRLANQPRGWVNDRVQVVNKKCKGSKVGQKDAVAAGFKMQIHASEGLHTHHSSFNTSPGTELYQHQWANSSLVKINVTEESFAVMWN